MTTTAITDTRRRLGASTQVLGPLALMGGALTHPKEVADAGEQLRIAAGASNRWYVAHVLYLLATVLLVPAVLSLGRRLRAAAPRLELWGTGLTVLGLFCTAALVAVEGIGGWQLAQSPDREAAARVFDHLTHSAGVVLPFAVLGLTLSAGLIVLAVGLARTGEAPAWVAWTLGAGAVVLAIGLVGELHPAFLAGIAAITVALVATGIDGLALEPAGRPLVGELAMNR